MKFESKYLSSPIPVYYSISNANLSKSPIGSTQVSLDWIDAIPFLKNQMDLWFGTNHRSEREFQQIVARENNYSNVTKGSDYFILDIEYQTTFNKITTRYDLIACKWPSTGSSRKKTNNLGLAFIEMKYGDKALKKGKAGIYDHLSKLNNSFQDSSFLTNIKEELKEVYNQKHELGVISNQKKITGFSIEKPEYILLIANHDPGSKVLINELSDLVNNQSLYKSVTKYVDIKVSVAIFHGYCLYSEHIFSLDDFLNKFSKQLFSI
jgi:hypothetical protein